jgi:molecular chaperone HscB
LSELRGRLAEAQRNFQEKLEEVDAELQSVFGEWDKVIDSGADEAARRAVSAKLNEVLNRRSYIRNLVRNVAQELEG